MAAWVRAPLLVVLRHRPLLACSLARGDFWQGDCFEIMREISVSQPLPSWAESERTERLICDLNVFQLTV